MFWEALFAALLLGGSQYFAVKYVSADKIHIAGHIIAWAVGMTVYAAAAAFGAPWAVYASAAAGNLALMAAEAIKGRQRTAFPAVVMCFCVDAVLAPMKLCPENMWSYGAAALTLIGCLLYALVYGGRTGTAEWFSNIYDENRAAYFGLALIPAAGLLLKAAVTAVAYPFSRFEPFVLIVVFLAVDALAFTLQRQIGRVRSVLYENESMARWQKESRDYMNTIRSQRHDFNIHLHTIVGMLENEDYESCKSYVKDMVQEASAVNDIMPVYDAVIGSMLYNMRRAARLKGTDIEYDIKYDMKNIICNAFECNKIIGNLIQNAIDAVNTEEELEYGIRVAVFKRHGSTVIKVSNLYDGDSDRIARAFDMNYTTKKNHDGIGLSMIKRTLKKYYGRIYAEMDERTVTFTVNIPNKITFDGEGGAADDKNGSGGR
ncbi:MAG: GHKL domain-containing protein [Butyrivibrio sp.]|nr:GHKL domain-containing protein [Butyrivibrio sp.]